MSPGSNPAGAPRYNQSLHAGRTVHNGNKNHVARLRPSLLRCARVVMQIVRWWQMLPEDVRNAILRTLFP